MTRKEAMRLTDQENVLMQLGFTQAEAESLRRISMTLQRWHERECGTDSGCIERGYRLARNVDKPISETNPVFTHDDNAPPYWADHSGERVRYWRIPDREKGAHKRLAAILKARNERAYVQGTDYYGLRRDELSTYIQTDPRGAALYILRPGDVPEGKPADAYYSRGVCVY